MLIQFTVKNYLSIKDEQVFSLAKASGDELSLTNSFMPNNGTNIPLLKSAAIYGANAAGKSNLIRAMIAMKDIVYNSASSSQEGDEIDVTPFLFDDISESEPSEFEMTFISEGVRYQYGFSATKHNIEEEWLVAYPKGRSQRWFSRLYDSDTKKSYFKFGDFLVGKKSVWQSATRTNALFLSTAVQLNSEQLQPVFNWFKTVLRPTQAGGWGSGFSASLCGKKPEKKKILSFLKAADFNIHDINIETEKFDPANLPSDIPESAREHLIKELKDVNMLNVKTVHKTENNRLIELDLESESDGTQRFFSYAGPWLDSLENGYVLVIDELHEHLHPKLVSYLVGLFHSKKTNPNNAQLIFTTHETSILSQDVFRRDQVWFCEKDKSQATSLYPLTDFSPRKDRENIEAGYLSGRYGALPYIRQSELKMA